MSPKSDKPVVASHWWRAHALPSGQTLRGRIGPLALEISRGPGEWRLNWTQEEERDEDRGAELAIEAGVLDDEIQARYVFAQTSAELRLRPLLLDRPVVIRPRQPVFIPAGESTTLYLSSPVVVSVEVGGGSTQLREVPTLRLSDIWFGPNSREGELCYSGRTRARYHLDEVPRREHRAITPVRISNAAGTMLPLEKLSLPVPGLSVYGAADGRLWTQEVALTRSGDSDLAALRVDRSPPSEAGKTELLSGPRAELERGGIVRAFSLFFNR